MLAIGPHAIDSPVLLAPMAGVSDAPFRAICESMGAGLTTSEMITADTSLWHTEKSRLRFRSHSNSALPNSIQIAGSEPQQLADAARACVDAGAEIIDINMGCPAKKVCRKAAGSALMRDEKLVAKLLEAVVSAADLPITLKMRTGWCPQSKNAVNIAHIAEATGIAALTVHGRTRACRFKGHAEFDTIAKVVDAVTIPVIANGDINSPEKASKVLVQTGAAAVMIGRAAQGQPWLIKAVRDYLSSDNRSWTPPSLEHIGAIVRDHICAIHEFYGDFKGVLIARKHWQWYLARLTNSNNQQLCSDFKAVFNSITTTNHQLSCVEQFFEHLMIQEEIAA